MSEYIIRPTDDATASRVASEHVRWGSSFGDLNRSDRMARYALAQLIGATEVGRATVRSDADPISVPRFIAEACMVFTLATGEVGSFNHESAPIAVERPSGALWVPDSSVRSNLGLTLAECMVIAAWIGHGASNGQVIRALYGENLDILGVYGTLDRVTLAVVTSWHGIESLPMGAARDLIESAE